MSSWTWKHYLFAALVLGALVPAVPSAAALVAGIAVALSLGNPFRDQTTKLTPKLLSTAVVCLGGAMDLSKVATVGVHGLGYTAVGILGTLGLGWSIGKLLRVDADTSLLVSCGTAICGGSAIAAVAVAIRAKSSEVTVAMVTVFLLNAIAIVLFPWIGHYYDMTQQQFGLWSALAIHDTSSVVGASLQYGAEALEIGTTVKLARALWIIPVSMGIGFLRARKAEASSETGGKIKRPWFILGFLAMAAVCTYIEPLRPAGEIIATVGRRLMVMTLFLIGAGLTHERLKQVGLRPFAQGTVLWIIMGTATLAAIAMGYVAL